MKALAIFLISLPWWFVWGIFCYWLGRRSERARVVEELEQNIKEGRVRIVERGR